jgi:hypothetical protein
MIGMSHSIIDAKKDVKFRRKQRQMSRNLEFGVGKSINTPPGQYFAKTLYYRIITEKYAWSVFILCFSDRHIPQW